MDPVELQKKEGTTKSVMDFNYKKGPGAVGCDIGGGSGLNRGSLGMEKLYCPMCYYSTWKD